MSAPIDYQHQRLFKLFECVAEEVASACGDGDGVVVFRKTDVQTVAKAFEEWKARTDWPKRLPVRKDFAPDHVLFSDGSNENITFISAANKESRREVQPWDPEVWMEVW